MSNPNEWPDIYVFQRQPPHAFLRADKAYPNPEAEGEFIKPFNSCYDAPPTPPEGSWPVREINSWGLIDDLRGTKYWVGEDEYTQEEFGPLPEGHSLVAPEPPPPTEAEIIGESQYVREAYIQSDIEMFGATYQVNNKAMININEAIDGAKEYGDTTLSVDWILKDNTTRLTTADELILIRRAYRDRKLLTFGAYNNWFAGDKAQPLTAADIDQFIINYQNANP